MRGPSASCHCGAIRIEAAHRPTTVTRCTCSVCRRYGALWAFYTRSTATVDARAEARAAYLWNDRVIEFCHCARCGCVTHYESAAKGDDSRVAVNARMMSPGDLEGARVRTFDGADTWKYLD